MLRLLNDLVIIFPLIFIILLLLDVYTLRLTLTLSSNVCNVIQLFRRILIGFADFPFVSQICS